MTNIQQMADRLPKYLHTNSKGEYDIQYRLLIIHNEWDGHKNAWIAGYFKDCKYHYSKKISLFQAYGTNICEAIENLSTMVNDYIGDGQIVGGKFLNTPVAL